jgi:glycerate kinase
MNTPGAGAAGGIAFGFMTATAAQLLPGADFVAAWLDVESHLAQADIVITGEGRFDDSSLRGKGPGALASRALELGKTAHVFAGQIALTSNPENLHLHAITPEEMSLTEAFRSASQLLTSAINAKL